MKEGRIEARFEPAKGWDKDYKDLRHLRRAAAELEVARKELKDVPGNLGGLRDKVGDALDIAVKETEKCLEFAK